MESLREEEVAAELAGLLKSPAADTEYDALPGSSEGKVLNADLARELSPHYKTKAQRIRYTRATYPPCSQYVLGRFRQAVEQAKWLDVPELQAPQVLFLAGGAASGKTTAIGERILGRADLVFDSNLAQFEKAVYMIQTALTWNWNVSVFYVHRSFPRAVESMVRRAADDGRYIPLRSVDGQDLATLHFNAQRTIVRLAHHFAGHRRVQITPWENAWTGLGPVAPRPISLDVLAEGGDFHYNKVEDLYALQEEIITRLQVEGLITGDLMAVFGIAPRQAT